MQLNNPTQKPAENIQISTLPDGLEMLNYIKNGVENASKRVVISLLYIENDDVGRDFVQHIFQVKKQNPNLSIEVHLDNARARRGRTDCPQDHGIFPVVQEISQQMGIPSEGIFHFVRSKGSEAARVAHMKGIVIDDEVLYSGASISEKYCGNGPDSRLDTYAFLRGSKALASFLVDQIRNGSSANIQQCMHTNLGKMTISGGEGQGSGTNQYIAEVIRAAEKQIFLATPYFNPTKQLQQMLRQAMEKGVCVWVLTGEKHTNDWWTDPADRIASVKRMLAGRGRNMLNSPKDLINEFKIILVGLLGPYAPYFYERQLALFAQHHQDYIDAGLLKIHLWEDRNRSFHAKWLQTDKHVVLTGHNFNARGEHRDAENAIGIEHNGAQDLGDILGQRDRLLLHSRAIQSFQDILSINDYQRHIQWMVRTFGRLKQDSL